mgnify:CR=1 FL=1
MQETHKNYVQFIPQFLILISKNLPRQTAIKGLLGMSIPNTPILVTDNFSSVIQHLFANHCSKVLVVIDGWSLDNDEINMNDLVSKLDAAIQELPNKRSVYLVENSKNFRSHQTSRVLAGDITGNQFMDTLRDLCK